MFQDFKFPIQSPKSNTCGLYFLYFAHNLIQKMEQQSVSFCIFDSFSLSVFQPLKHLQDLNLVLFCNGYCNTNFLSKKL